MGLFYKVNLMQSIIKNVYKLDTSLEFLTCADNKLTDWFYNKTGLRASKTISIGITFAYKIKEDGTVETDENIIREKNYVKNEISGMPFSLHIRKNENPVLMVWWSKSGRIYELTDTDIDYDDIEFALNPFEPQLYYTQLNYRDPHPFNTENFSFELEVVSLGINTTMELNIHSGKESFIQEFVQKAYAFIETYNNKSMAKNRKYGVVHSSLVTHKNNKVTIELDAGSAGIRFYESLLKMISATSYFSRVTMS